MARNLVLFAGLYLLIASGALVFQAQPATADNRCVYRSSCINSGFCDYGPTDYFCQGTDVYAHEDSGAGSCGGGGCLAFDCQVVHRWQNDCTNNNYCDSDYTYTCEDGDRVRYSDYHTYGCSSGSCYETGEETDSDNCRVVVERDSDQCGGTSCEDQCTEGDRKCLGDRVVECRDTDSDSCTDGYETVETCGSGEQCLSGSCVSSGGGGDGTCDTSTCEWVNCGCGGGRCSSSKMQYTQDCSDPDCNSDGCGGDQIHYCSASRGSCGTGGSGGGGDGGSGGSNTAPTADFSYSPEEPVEAQDVDFDASSSSDPDGSITSYDWDWTSDGVYEDTGVTATHAFGEEGDYTVTLRVTDDAGASDTGSREVSVQVDDTPPDVNCGDCDSPDPVRAGNSVTFDPEPSDDVSDGSDILIEVCEDSGGSPDCSNLYCSGTDSCSYTTPENTYSVEDYWVRATDEEGNANTSAASYSFTVKKWEGDTCTRDAECLLGACNLDIETGQKRCEFGVIPEPGIFLRY